MRVVKLPSPGFKWSPKNRQLLIIIKIIILATWPAPLLSSWTRHGMSLTFTKCTYTHAHILSYSSGQICSRNWEIYLHVSQQRFIRITWFFEKELIQQFMRILEHWDNFSTVADRKLNFHQSIAVLTDSLFKMVFLFQRERERRKKGDELLQILSIMTFTKMWSVILRLLLIHNSSILINSWITGIWITRIDTLRLSGKTSFLVCGWIWKYSNNIIEASAEPRHYLITCLLHSNYFDMHTSIPRNISNIPILLHSSNFATTHT